MRFGDRVRNWRQDGFKLELWDTHEPTGRGYLGDTYLAYRFCDRSKVIFQGVRSQKVSCCDLPRLLCGFSLRRRWFDVRA